MKKIICILAGLLTLGQMIYVAAYDLNARLQHFMLLTSVPPFIPIRLEDTILIPVC